MCVCLTNSSKCYTNTRWAFLPCSSQTTLRWWFLNKNPPSNQWGIKNPDVTIWHMEIVWMYSKQIHKGEGNISSLLPVALLKLFSSFKSTSVYQLLADFRDHLSSSKHDIREHQQFGSSLFLFSFNGRDLDRFLVIPKDFPFSLGLDITANNYSPSCGQVRSNEKTPNL